MFSLPISTMQHTERGSGLGEQSFSETTDILYRLYDDQIRSLMGDSSTFQTVI
ncbi:MAG: hypothetical protein QXL17_00255 [Candidatus Thermoplasmatota archaeon]